MTAFALYLLSYSDFVWITDYPTKARCEAQVEYINSQMPEEIMKWRLFICIQMPKP